MFWSIRQDRPFIPAPRIGDAEETEVIQIVRQLFIIEFFLSTKENSPRRL
ncbi:hypothetical protein ACLK1S_18600 [Escherichia coli]